MIFFQGVEDRVVPPAQAETMVAALARRGVPHAYVTFEGEGHGFRRAESLVTALEAELSFASSQARLARVMQSRGVSSPEVEVAGRTVFLRGVAASEHDRALVAQLASLEPGVSQVENLVTIQAPPAR